MAKRERVFIRTGELKWTPRQNGLLEFVRILSPIIRFSASRLICPRIPVDVYLGSSKSRPYTLLFPTKNFGKPLLVLSVVPGGDPYLGSSWMGS
jgi:hypothetical protein